MFQNLLAKFGFGSAKVDLVLHQNTYMLGETVTGELTIQGGKIEQKINKIDVDFQLSILKDEQTYQQRIQTFPFHQSFNIQPGELRSFPFSYSLPLNLPISSSTVQFYFITRLDIASGLDSSDRDEITIEPPVPLQKVLTALNQLGFQEKHDSREFEGHAQEFELAPISGPFYQRVKEVEFFAGVDQEGVHLLLEIEKPALIGEHEIKREIFIPNETIEDPTALVNFLQQTITEMVNHPDQFRSGTFTFFSDLSSSKISKTLGVAAIGGFAAGLLATTKAIEIVTGSDDNEDDDEIEDFFDDQDDEDDEDDFEDFFDDYEEQN